jgi:phage terminase small subunit
VARPETAARGVAKAKELSDRQLRFVAEYAVDYNGTQAAIRAGYSPRTANEQAARLLAKASVKSAVAEKQAEAEAKTDITIERLLHELALIAFSDIRHFAVDDLGQLRLVDGAPDEAWRAVSSVKHRITTTKAGDTLREVEYRLWNKNGAIDLAGKHLGMFMERQGSLPAPDFVETPVDVNLGLAAASRMLDQGLAVSDAGKLLPYRKRAA